MMQTYNTFRVEWSQYILEALLMDIKENYTTKLELFVAHKHHILQG